MFFRKGHSFLIAIIFCLIGLIISYIACQYTYFKIDTEIKVIDLILSLGTIGIGLYIALILEEKRSKSQNFYSYVEKKYDALWEYFIQFSNILEFSPSIELKETSKHFKLINQKLAPLVKIFESFEYDTQSLKQIEQKIDALDDFLSANPNTANMIIDLSHDRQHTDGLLKEINEMFAKSFKDLGN
jgi:hypothetical protein